jgi:hypothetical protein
MAMSRNQNAGQSHSINIYNSSLKGWNSSNFWEQHQQIKILFMIKITAYCSQGMLVVIQ